MDQKKLCMNCGKDPVTTGEICDHCRKTCPFTGEQLQMIEEVFAEARAEGIAPASHQPHQGRSGRGIVIGCSNRECRAEAFLTLAELRAIEMSITSMPADGIAYARCMKCRGKGLPPSMEITNEQLQRMGRPN